jgi:membrane protease YdiL (CAAX protease family)
VGQPLDAKSVALRVGLYIFFYWVTLLAVSHLLVGLAGYLVGGSVGTLVAAFTANLLTVRIYEQRDWRDIGLRGGRASAVNLAWGLAGGGAMALVVLGGPLLAGMARLEPAAGAPDLASAALLAAMLLAGSAGEEMCFRGYAFQLLIRRMGPFSTIFPVGAAFALLHGGNPYSTWHALLNTAGFGILFGVAFWRSRDIWLPIGLHYGWNLVLPLFGANVSGFTMKLTAYEMRWNAGPLWSGGDYGPEASLLTSGAFVLLAVFVWKAPIRRQVAPLLEGAPE